MNIARYRKRSGYEKRLRWSQNAVTARARNRIERAHAELSDEEPFVDTIKRALPDAVITIRLPKVNEAKTFRVYRVNESRLLALGKIQAASTIGKRLALVLENLI